LLWLNVKQVQIRLVDNELRWRKPKPYLPTFLVIFSPTAGDLLRILPIVASQTQETTFGFGEDARAQRSYGEDTTSVEEQQTRTQEQPPAKILLAIRAVRSH
jgi:hypothetical protein